MKAEDIRREVMLYLADRPAAAMAATAILSHLKGEGHSVSPGDVEAALTFLLKDGWVSRQRLGAQSTWRYTAEPKLTLAAEAGEL